MSTEIIPPAPDLHRAVIRSANDAEALHAKVLRGAERTAAWLQGFSGSPLELLTALRFQTVGHDPLTGDALSVIEQLNQNFTILVSRRAVERLIEMHPEANGFRLALATSSGRDIESVEPDLVAAEVFSATHPGSNQKLRKGGGNAGGRDTRRAFRQPGMSRPAAVPLADSAVHCAHIGARGYHGA